MEIKVGFEIAYAAVQPTPMVTMLNIHPSRFADIVGTETIATEPSVPIGYYRDSFGNVCGRLVAPAGGERIQRLAGEARKVDFFEAGGSGAAHEVAHAFVVEGGEAVARGGHAPFAEFPAALRPGQPAGDAAGRVEFPELAEHLRGAQEVVADEAGELGADAVLVAGDDGRVRYRQPQRMTEQRHHREPVGNGADHRGLGERGHVAPGGVLRMQHAGYRIEHGGAAQQAQCYALHVLQAVALFCQLRAVLVWFGVCAQATGCSPPRMSPGLRPPPLFRCGEHPVSCAQQAPPLFRSINQCSERSRRRGALRSEIKEEGEARGTFAEQGTPSA